VHTLDNDKWFLSKVTEGILTVSKDGTVYNNKTKRFIGAISSNGYVKISMYSHKEDGKEIIRHMQVHRLVWLAFVGPIPQDMFINHKNLNKTDASLVNLELVTRSENMRHAVANNAMPTLYKGGNVVHLKRKTYGNRYRKGIPKAA
jgi:hypothetical protein